MEEEYIKTPLVSDPEKAASYAVGLWRGYAVLVLIRIFMHRFDFVKFLLDFDQNSEFLMFAYVTHYFASRLRGNNFVIGAWGVKTNSKSMLMFSDISGAIMYLMISSKLLGFW
ncbi:MAG: hypothetical protein AB1400_05405 [Pseudomonadota bacterium]